VRLRETSELQYDNRLASIINTVINQHQQVGSNMIVYGSVQFDIGLDWIGLEWIGLGWMSQSSPLWLFGHPQLVGH
jgi:hypothetical protein